jgi:hypothetical protein
MEIIVNLKCKHINNVKDLLNEVWKDIPDYEDIYQVSNKGRIKSLARIVGNCKRKDKIIIPKDNGTGYYKVNLYKNGKHKNYYVHKLVASVFINNESNKPCINHKDYNRKNNNVENLEWVTYKENNNYSCCSEHAALKNSLRVLVVDLDNNPIKMFASIHQCGRYFNVDASHISGIIHNNYIFCKQYKLYSAYDEHSFDVDIVKLEKVIKEMKEDY